MRAYIVDKKALVSNIQILKHRAGDTPIWGVVKGNGYGLGCAALAKVLYDEGIRRFAVTDIAEVRALREAGFWDCPILMMEGTCEVREIDELLALEAILSVGSEAMAEAVSHRALERDVTAHIHVKIDSGMGRFGFLPDQMRQVHAVYTDYPGLTPIGIYTHFHSARNAAVTKDQYERFRRVVEELRAAGYPLGMVHCCNSTGFWKYPEYHSDGVRVGSAVLGRVNFEGDTGLKKVGYCTAAIEDVRQIPKGHTVGYGAGWKAKRSTKIAIVPVGYTHGFAVDRGFDLWRLQDCLRGVARYIKAFLKKKALYVRINGKPCKVLGHVGMVNMVVDVTKVDCRPGDLARVEINPLLVRGMEVRFE